MYTPGLVSVSFRRLTPEQVLHLCRQAKLEAVEWGGDIHVPAGDEAHARKIASVSMDSGVKIASYGSYFRAGDSMDVFRRNLDTACALGAPVIRVWAGTKGSGDCTSQERSAWVDQLCAANEMAGKQGVILAAEFHPGTLTDALGSVARLLKEAPGMRMYWQPRWDWPEQDRLEGLKLLGGRLMHMHVFSWRHVNGGVLRLPLQDGEAFWKKVFSQPREQCYALMEFVENDDPQALLRDARVLRGWLCPGAEK